MRTRRPDQSREGWKKKKKRERESRGRVGGGQGLSYTWNQLEEAAKRADYCLDRSVGHFTDKPELAARKTRHQKLSVASQGSSVMIVFGLRVSR